jgi:hypothetical protein
MSKHCYALVSETPTRHIVRTTEPLFMPPANVPFHVWQQVTDDSPHFNPTTHERHSPRVVLRNDGRCYREFAIRRKADG